MMFRLFYITLMIPLLLCARDNPFEPTDTVVKKAESRSSLAVNHPNKTEQTERINTSIARFLIDGKVMQIETKDTLKKHFSLASPGRVVMDFEGYADFATKRIKTKSAAFTQVTVGVHDGYYRVVITVPQMKAYRVSKDRYGYRLTLDSGE